MKVDGDTFLGKIHKTSRAQAAAYDTMISKTDLKISDCLNRAQEEELAFKTHEREICKKNVSLAFCSLNFWIGDRLIGSRQTPPDLKELEARMQSIPKNHEYRVLQSECQRLLDPKKRFVCYPEESENKVRYLTVKIKGKAPEYLPIPPGIQCIRNAVYNSSDIAIELDARAYIDSLCLFKKKVALGKNVVFATTITALALGSLATYSFWKNK